MGNINYKNFICDNYYCQSVSFKPEWFSENNWNIKYSLSDNKCSDKLIAKPYIIDKGILKIKQIDELNIILSKKLLINFNDIRNISIPLLFKYKLLNSDSKNIDMFIIISNNNLEINDINKIKDIKDKSILFYTHLNLLKNILYINHSFDTKIIKKKINSKKINKYNLDIQNNYEMLLLTEKVSKYIEEKYIINNNFSEDNEYYINIFIKINEFKNKEFIELSFE